MTFQTNGTVSKIVQEELINAQSGGNCNWTPSPPYPPRASTWLKDVNVKRKLFIFFRRKCIFLSA